MILKNKVLLSLLWVVCLGLSSSEIKAEHEIRAEIFCDHTHARDAVANAVASATIQTAVGEKGRAIASNLND